MSTKATEIKERVVLSLPANCGFLQDSRENWQKGNSGYLARWEPPCPHLHLLSGEQISFGYWKWDFWHQKLSEMVLWLATSVLVRATRRKNGVPLSQKTNSHHTPPQIPPSNMSALGLNKPWVKEESKAYNTDNLESNDSNHKATSMGGFCALS